MGVNTARKLKIVRPFRDPRDWVRPTTHFLRDCDKQVVRHIGDFAASLVDIRDAELLERTQEIRLRVAAGAPLCSYDVLVPMFALVNESLRRSLGFVYYDVQLYAGIVLATGAIAEMKTGEGKTIVAALPACLHALNGRGVHVATVNQYLAERDCQELSPVYRRLGFEVGITRADQPQDKKIAYDCDITYGTGYEFGFDFLRDQLSRQCSPRPRLGERFRQSLQGQTPAAVPGMQRGHAMAIVDEVDSVLLDEATTPLIISLAASASTDVIKAYHRARHVADTLNEDVDFTVDARTKSIRLTDDGSSKVHAPPLHPPATGLLRPWSTYVEQSLKACLLLTRDVDYVVRDGKVMIVDQYTGRIFSERSWNDGLHQSVEVKEGLEVTAERRSAARISRQRYFQMYENLCGMTGTATGHEAEFHKFYRLPVVVVPERRPNRRVALPTRVFPSSDDKYKFVATDVKQRAGRGQPVLIGTRTIEESQRVAQQLDQLCIPFQLLNGKQDEAEAELVGR
ncbi:MAG: translocase, partial [Planctomycetales bacterium]|nr:translocase [Planctomycetales bacterium]